MVADAVIYHPTLAHYLKYVSTTVGRDKLLRTIQYFSRFYAWYLFRTNALPSTIAPFEAIKKQFGLARKLMRVGKNVEHFKAAAVAYDTKGTDQFLRYCAIGRQLGYGGYLTLDALTYLNAAGIKKSDSAKRLGKEAYKYWFAGLAFSAMSGIYGLYRLRERETKLNKEIGEGVVESKRLQKYVFLGSLAQKIGIAGKLVIYYTDGLLIDEYRERAAINLQLLSDLCDLTVPTAALGWVSLDDGIVGLAGTVSSLIGVYGAWKKTA
jgi:peroxin-11B